MYFKAVKDPTMMYKVIGEKGGVVPEELKGQYTKKHFADQAIQAYVNKKAKHEATAHTATRSSGSTRAPRKKASSGDRQEAS